ncbi:B9 domain-containing protein 2 [Condylostylus longicornis]|uniref:B9 domain-containing protein 2 n=1 Tax=Condylostylus longicornis TaxID=2530218 RepID=UPI00244E09D1|nr:B9 domain-containing protein 2 [Condylostylus longicornis]
MAELHIFGQILKAVNFEEPKLFCKWSIQAGSSWSFIEGENEGQTVTAIDRLEESTTFCQPLDLHLACRAIQGWPKIYVEVYAVNCMDYCWPVGFGFVHIPSSPGTHTVEINTWRISPNNFWDKIKDKFYSGGFALSKSDLIHSGIERYKLQTRSSGKVIIDLSLIFRNFAKYGIEF